eukprot:6184468-Pleurochrysis_carterae.AAC.1
MIIHPGTPSKFLADCALVVQLSLKFKAYCSSSEPDKGICNVQLRLTQRIEFSQIQSWTACPYLSLPKCRSTRDIVRAIRCDLKHGLQALVRLQNAIPHARYSLSILPAST